MQTVQIVSCRNIFFPSYREQRVLCINIWFVRVTPLHTCMCNIMSYLFISFRIFWNDLSRDRQHRHIWSGFSYVNHMFFCSYDQHTIAHMICHTWYSYVLMYICYIYDSHLKCSVLDPTCFVPTIALFLSIYYILHIIITL